MRKCSFETLLVAAITTVTLLHIALLEVGILRIRYSLCAVGLTTLLSFAFVYAKKAPLRYTLAVSALCLLCILVQVIVPLANLPLANSPETSWDALHHLVWIASCLTISLIAPLAESPSTDGCVAQKPEAVNAPRPTCAGSSSYLGCTGIIHSKHYWRAMLVALTIVYAGGITFGLNFTRQKRPVMVDETVYLMEALTLFSRQDNNCNNDTCCSTTDQGAGDLTSYTSKRYFGFNYPPETERWFRLRQTFDRPAFDRPAFDRAPFDRAGTIFGQYPPGWPFVLAIFNLFGLIQIAPAVISVMALASTYALADTLARRRHSEHCTGQPASQDPRQVGLLSVILLGANPLFLFYSASFYAHVVTSAFVTLSAYCFLASGERNSRQTMVSGLLFGVALIARPVTAVALLIGCVIWLVTAREVKTKDLIHALLPFTVGLGLPAVGALLYSFFTTGEIFISGYQAAQGTLHNLGFGQRGMRMFSPDGTPWNLIYTFGPKEAIAHLYVRLLELLHSIVPMYLGIAICVFGLYGKRAPINLALAPMLAPLLALSVFYAFYVFSDIRFYLEAFPFVTIAVSRLLCSLRQSRPHFAWILTSAIIVSGLAIFCGKALGYREHVLTNYEPSFKQIDDIISAKQPTLIFVKDVGFTEPLFESLYTLNVSDRTPCVRVARDLGDDNATLRRLYPGYNVVNLKWPGPPNYTIN